MEQDKRATVPGLSQGEGQGGDVPAGEKAGDEDPSHGDASPEEDDAKPADGGGHGDAAAEGDKEKDLKEALADDSEGIAAAGNAGRAAALGSAKNEELELPTNPFATRFRFRAATGHPTPPPTYRRLPLRSRKQYNPIRFFAAGACVSAMSTTGQGAMNEAQGSTVTSSELDATVDNSNSDKIESGTDAGATSSASTSHRLPSRSRKQSHPDHFIPEEAEASVRTKARRSNAVLDRFLTDVLRVPPERRPGWVRNVAADDVDDQEQPEEEEGPEEPDGRARILTVLAVLGASMALCVVACVLFYIIAQRTAHGR